MDEILWQRRVESTPAWQSMKDLEKDSLKRLHRLA
ncbi:hypothetical protein NEOC65_000332 [Neochlamydia sp. AcF65]|nr:hypothetical protein [Neochlamydia sp. AcF65]